MTIRSTPPITLTDVMTELRTRSPGRAYPLSLGDADARVIAGIPSGPVSLSNMYGKTYYITMTINSSPGTGDFSSAGGGGTATCNPSVAVGDGDPPYTYLWSFTSNPNGCSLSFATSSSCQVSKAFSALTTGSASAVLQCQVTDNTAHVQTKTGITASLTWDSGA